MGKLAVIRESGDLVGPMTRREAESFQDSHPFERLQVTDWDEALANEPDLCALCGHKPPMEELDICRECL